MNISAQYIFTGTTKPLKLGIISLDNTGEIIDIIDTNGKLKESGNIKFYNGIICPGFVNTHCHIELSHMRGVIPEKMGMVNFIEKVVGLRSDFSPEQILTSVVEADKEMQRNGIVAVGDISNSPDSLELKKNSKLFYHTFVEVFGLDETNADELFESGLQLKNEYINNNLSCSITPHAPYSVSELLFENFREYYNLHNEIISFHNQETQQENEMFEGKDNEMKQFMFKLLSQKGSDNLFKKQTTSVQSVFEFLMNAKKMLFIHNTFVKEEDFHFLKEFLHKIFWILCPNSNLYIENNLPPVELIRKYSDNICIGTDSLSSNRKLCVLNEIKTISETFPSISLEEIVKWATINGAKALEIDKKYGSIEIGKKPGINLIKNIDLKNLKLTNDSQVEVLQ